MRRVDFSRLKYFLLSTIKVAPPRSRFRHPRLPSRPGPTPFAHFRADSDPRIPFFLFPGGASRSRRLRRGSAEGAAGSGLRIAPPCRRSSRPEPGWPSLFPHPPISSPRHRALRACLPAAPNRGAGRKAPVHPGGKSGEPPGEPLPPCRRSARALAGRESAPHLGSHAARSRRDESLAAKAAGDAAIFAIYAIYWAICWAIYWSDAAREAHSPS